MRIYDVRNPQPLVLAALGKHIGRVRRVDQYALSGGPVSEHVAKVAIAAATDLFEDKLHAAHPSFADRRIGGVLDLDPSVVWGVGPVRKG